jgi:hypothetical protein
MIMKPPMKSYTPSMSSASAVSDTTLVGRGRGHVTSSTALATGLGLLAVVIAIVTVGGGYGISQFRFEDVHDWASHRWTVLRLVCLGRYCSFKIFGPRPDYRQHHSTVVVTGNLVIGAPISGGITANVKLGGVRDALHGGASPVIAGV